MDRTVVGAFDRIVIQVPELDAAARELHCLLGIEPVVAPCYQGQAAARWFVLPNTVIELVPAEVPSALIRGVIFVDSAAVRRPARVANILDLDIRRCDGADTAVARADHACPAAAGLRVDHLVLRTTDAQGCVELFGQQLGIRLALDQNVPEWGGRMLFFRTGKLTLEVIAGQRADSDAFWGIAYQCSDIEHMARQLAARGVQLSAIRAGRKAGSRVATVKSHNLGIPTLLLEPPVT